MRRSSTTGGSANAARRPVSTVLASNSAWSARHVLGSGAGRRGQEPLWRMVLAGQLLLAETNASMLARMPALMERYWDLPMDLADASLVALAEDRHLREVFTLDSHFRVYRLPDGDAFNLVP